MPQAFWQNETKCQFTKSNINQNQTFRIFSNTAPAIFFFFKLNFVFSLHTHLQLLIEIFLSKMLLGAPLGWCWGVSFHENVI